MIPNPKRNLSTRNTHWNGRQQLLYDHHEHTKADYRWQGHVNNGSDTGTNASSRMFDIQAQGFEEMNRFLDAARDNMTFAAQDAIAKTAAEGRKLATKVEENKFRLGQRWQHSGASYDPEMGPRFHIWESRSEYNGDLGGYVGFNSSGNKMRLINFHFIKGHTYKALKDMPGTVEAKVTSQLANLFENDAHWNSNSPMWKNANGGPWYGFKRGQTRKGKHYFGELYNAFGQGMHAGVAEAAKSFERRMTKSYKGAV